MSGQTSGVLNSHSGDGSRANGLFAPFCSIRCHLPDEGRLGMPPGLSVDLEESLNLNYDYEYLDLRICRVRKFTQWKTRATSDEQIAQSQH